MEFNTLKQAPENEDELVRRGLRGDSGALDYLFSRHAPALYRNALRVMGDEDEAQDALQDGLLSAFRNLHRFEGRSRFSTWLTRIVINAALMRLRKKRTHDTVSIDEEPREEESTLAEQLPDPRPDPEALSLQGELQRNLENSLNSLPERLRKALVLRHIEGLSTEEVAETLGVGENTLKSRVRRARLQVAASEWLSHYAPEVT
jgi:RNA polymerase sigma-70 factor (ECF subfamily)